MQDASEEDDELYLPQRSFGGLPILLPEDVPGIDSLTVGLCDFHPLHDREPGLIPDWEGSLGCILSCGIMEEGRISVIGSATMVAPGIAITAFHVAQEMAGSGGGPMMFGIYGEHAIPWRVTGFVQAQMLQPDLADKAGTDLALAFVEPASPFPDGFKLAVAQMTTRCPTVDESVIMVGFVSSRDIPVTTDLVAIPADMLLAKGAVSAIHEIRRDRVMCPWPTIEVRCKAESGMSGGPVFDRFGRLFAIVGTSFDSSDGLGPSTVSPIYPLMATEFKAAWPPFLHKRRGFLRDVTGCAIERPKAIRIDWTTRRARYRKWS